MKNIDKIINENIRTFLLEEPIKKGTYFTLPYPPAKGSAMLAKMYGGSPSDYPYDQANNRFVYRPQILKKTRAKKVKGRPEGMSDEEYLELVRRENEAFLKAEQEFADAGEQWRPIKNAGRYFGGTTDYQKTHEISNMGRIRTIDFSDPMKSKISTGYDAPTRSARQFHLDSMDDSGNWLKTCPPIHTLVADAWLEPPEGDIGSYSVEHINGDYNDNRAENLRYVKRNAWKNKKKKDMGESKNFSENDIRTIVRETMSRLFESVDKQSEYYQDALEAIEMTDGIIDFYEWYPAFHDVLDPEEAEQIFDAALNDYTNGNMMNEIADTKRGQFMLGRAMGRAHERGDWDTMKDIHDRVDTKDLGVKFNDKSPVHFGYMNQTRKIKPSTVDANYKAYKRQDMDKLKSAFRQFSDKYKNCYGNLKVPLEDVIRDFGQQVLGYECTPDIIDALTPKPSPVEFEDPYDYDESFGW